MENITENENEIQEQPRHRSIEKISYAEKGRFFAIRQILNLLFILLAIAGAIIYYFFWQEAGGILLITAVIIKITECVLRIMH